MRSCGSCGLVRRGVTCPNATGRGRPHMSGCGCGPRTAPGSGSWTGHRQGRLGRGRRVGHQRGLHRHPGSPARSWRPEKGGCSPAVEALAVEGEGIGRSRGGLSTKAHLAVDGRGLPMRVIMTPGQDGGNPQLLPLLDGIRVARPGPGRPRSRPETVLADKAYSHPSTRAALRRRRIQLISPSAPTRSPAAKPRALAAARPPSTPSCTNSSWRQPMTNKSSSP
jgi:transposase